MYIPYFEQHIEPLWAIAKLDMNQDITTPLPPSYEATKRDTITALCNTPCLACYDFEKHIYLLTDF